MDHRAYLNEFMKRRKLTKQELAHYLGLNVSTVTHWLNGTRNVPTVVTRVMMFFDDYNLDFRSFYVE